MLDSKTIYGTLLVGLLGCSGSDQHTDVATQDSASAAAPTQSAAPPEKTAEPVASTPATSAPAPAASSSAATPAASSSAAAKPKLPMGRTEPLPPKDKKTVPASQSKRTGADACCGAGTCGPC